MASDRLINSRSRSRRAFAPPRPAALDQKSIHFRLERMDRRAVAAVVQRLRARLRARCLRCRGRDGGCWLGVVGLLQPGAARAPAQARRHLCGSGCNAKCTPACMRQAASATAGPSYNELAAQHRNRTHRARRLTPRSGSCSRRPALLFAVPTMCETKKHQTPQLASRHLD